MSKTRFALAPLLDRYRFTEERCRVDAAASIRARDDIREAIVKLEEQLCDWHHRNVAHRALVERAIVARTRSLGIGNEECARAREALCAASRDRAVLERLEARQRAQWLRRERRSEEREAGW